MKQAHTHTLLPEIRKKRGMAVADLAHRVGVTRQTIYAIEEGDFVPNTTVALRLARVLEVHVEDLFALDNLAADSDEPLQAELLPGHSGLLAAGDLVRLCRVQDRLLAIPIPSLPAFLPPVDGVVEKTSGRTLSVTSVAGAFDDDKRVLLAGCDPALSLLTELLALSAIEIVTAPCPSRTGLQWLKQGRVHAAGSHLLDHASGEYNIPIIRRAFPKGSVRVVTFASWQQGLVIQRGNPKTIRSIADLHRKDITIVNREPGSGSRDLLETGLRTLGITAAEIRGFDDVARGHLAAAYAVASKRADCCIATQSAARRFGLDFVPLALERFDLTFSQRSLDLSATKALLEVLNSGTFRTRLRTIAGYETQETGTAQL